MPEYAKPLPTPDADSKPFWDAAKRHQFLVQRCRDCGNSVFYPRAVCPTCLSHGLEWAQVSGKGRVYTYTVVRRATNPAFAKDVPYVYAIIELDEGPRIISNIVQCLPGDVRIGLPVEVVFDDVTETFTLPKFKPAGR